MPDTNENGKHVTHADGVTEAKADTERLKRRIQKHYNVTSDQFLKVWYGPLYRAHIRFPSAMAKRRWSGENTSIMAISSRLRIPTSRPSSIKSSDSLSRREFPPALGCWTSGAASAELPDTSPENEVAR